MDRKTGTILMAAKYGAYLITLWIVVSFDFSGTRAIAALMLAFAMDAIRHFYLQDRSQRLTLYSIYAQYALVLAFTLIEQSGIAIVLYVILVTDALMSFGWPVANRVFGLSLVSFALSGIGIGLGKGQPPVEVVSVSVINSMFLVFAYGIGYTAKRQTEEKQRAEAALEELHVSRAELAQAHQQLLLHSKQQERLAVIEERNRIAREIHDTVAHSLTTVVVGMEAAKRLMDKDAARAYTELEKSQDQARRGLDDLRRSVKALRPRVLDEVGLSDAVRGLGRDYAAQGVAVAVQVGSDQELDIPEQYELPLFRIIQECLTNAVRHGQATQISVTLARLDGATLSIQVRDNGTGCAELTEGSGLRGIRERLEAIGGRVEVLPRGEDGASGFSVKAVIEGVLQ